MDAMSNILVLIHCRCLQNDKVQSRVRQLRFYEKPYMARQRLSYEKTKRIYNTDMRNKIEFLMRKNRADPWIR